MATNPYIGQAQINTQIQTEGAFKVGDEVTWKSQTLASWWVQRIVDTERFVLQRENGDTWEVWQKWFVKIN